MPHRWAIWLGVAGLPDTALECSIRGGAQQRFSESEIVELTAHIALENYNAKSNRPLRVDANNFCEIPLPASKT